MQKTDWLLILSGSIDQTSSISTQRSSLFTVGTTQSYLVELYVGLNLKVGIFTNLLSIRSTYLYYLYTTTTTYFKPNLFYQMGRIRINFECRFPLSCRGGAGKADTLRVNNFSTCQFMLVIPVNFELADNSFCFLRIGIYLVEFNIHFPRKPCTKILPSFHFARLIKRVLTDQSGKYLKMNCF